MKVLCGLNVMFLKYIIADRSCSGFTYCSSFLWATGIQDTPPAAFKQNFFKQMSEKKDEFHR